MYFTPLNLPTAPLSLMRSSGIVKVRCLIRNKHVVLTPEEWVRQHILNYMMSVLLYPKSYIAVEFSLKYNGGIKRCDILVVDKKGDPLLIIECKSPDVKLSLETFLQVSKYDNSLKAKYLSITNGLMHLYVKKTFSSNDLSPKQGILSWKEALSD